MSDKRMYIASSTTSINPHLEQQRVDGLLLDSLLDALHIGHQQVVAHDLDGLAWGKGERGINNNKIVVHNNSK